MTAFDDKVQQYLTDLRINQIEMDAQKEARRLFNLELDAAVDARRARLTELKGATA